MTFSAGRHPHPLARAALAISPASGRGDSPEIPRWEGLVPVPDSARRREAASVGPSSAAAPNLIAAAGFGLQGLAARAEVAQEVREIVDAVGDDMHDQAFALQLALDPHQAGGQHLAPEGLEGARPD